MMLSLRYPKSNLKYAIYINFYKTNHINIFFSLLKNKSNKIKQLVLLKIKFQQYN